MRYLNLSPNFNPFGAKDGHIIKYKFFYFKGGEPHITIDSKNIKASEPITISIRLTNFLHLGKLAVAVDALRRLGFDEHINLFIPYFPGARQDRVANKGEALTVKIYADFINNLDCDRVIIFDPHSDVTPALLDNCTVIDNFQFVVDVLDDAFANHEDFHLVCPDSGANKKMKDLQKGIMHDSLIKCDKTRDTQTGEISGFEVYANDLEGKPCLIIDDICDGGGTFIGLAKELKKKNAGKLYLAVSHGIFSKGYVELDKYFDGIYTTDSFKNVPKTEDLRSPQHTAIYHIKNFKEIPLNDMLWGIMRGMETS